MPPPSQIPAGWYPDPSDARVWRYWNATAWTENTAPRTLPAPLPPVIAPNTSEVPIPAGRTKPGKGAAPKWLWPTVIVVAIITSLLLSELAMNFAADVAVRDF
ncbi:hypothetical protein GCM10011313_09710 [Mycetocola zhadangensis]|nr:hypothetical protein GCM10011313_09710 [Mycetocola zhadangensis]